MYLKHGLSNTPEYRCWQQIKARCLNPEHRAYADYGGRGIGVHPAWVSSFETFLADVGSRPSPKHSLDRFPDNDGDYAPGNVRWATPTEQNNNKRDQRPRGLKPPIEPTDKITNFKHGMIKAPEYQSWLAMKDRCLNPHSSNLAGWGGRGITIHEPWIKDFRVFYTDVGPKPSARHTLDRFPDKNGPYAPGNVRWATKLEQTHNRRPLKKGPTHGNFKHGLRDTPEYTTWGSMRTRCFNSNDEHYPDNGGRGITICQRWSESFEAFLEDLGPKPSPKHSIYRKDRDKSYTCGKCKECIAKSWSANCRWGTTTEQNRNRRPSTRSGKLDESKVGEIRRLLSEGQPRRVVAKMFGVGRTLIDKIDAGLIWKNIPPKVR